MSNNLLKLPKIGDNATNVTILSWLKDIGDYVEEGDPIIEISINQGNSLIPSEFSGELKEKRFKVGDIIKTGEVIAEIENDDDVFNLHYRFPFFNLTT